MVFNIPPSMRSRLITEKINQFYYFYNLTILQAAINVGIAPRRMRLM